ncbi:vitamin B12 transporter [Polaromonas sp. OV174]|uniref:TonB-dependent receptor domain-containing protein n=1 Tax=Polaromonas sp. OV174 TaxID=1855300 RepID=UPI0008EF68E8|nr:TonB-dependent receptor [Polaromonas sp. OV174]SFB94090.1 vitamin B12 transporter [Polaromonas sp. OV174]
MKTCVSTVRLAVLPLALAAAFPSFSQTQAAPQLKEMVVTATRSAQPLSDVVADVTIIDRERIERSGAVGLADVLKRIPGIEISRNGGPASTTSVFLRGAESRFTAVYIDGVRIDSQATGGAAWEAIPLALIDRIEVLRGPAGAVYGSDALGGVIQIFTKRGETGFAPYADAGFGTYDTRKLGAGFSGASGAFDYALGLAYEKSDGFNARTIPTQNPDLDGYRTESANLRLGFQLNKAHRLEATYLTSDSNSGYDNGLGKDDRNLHKLQTLGLNWQAQWTEAWSTRLSVNESSDRYETKPSPYLTLTKLRGYTLQNEFRVGEHLLTAALERKEDHLENAPINQGRSQNAVALGYGLSHQAHTLQLNLRHDKDSEFGGKTTGSAAYAYAFTPAWRATASAGTAFRAPTLYQRFSEYGVPTLVPESSRNVELGLHWTQGASSAGLVAYRNKVDNLITFAAAGPCKSSFGCYANTARAEYSGATLSATHAIGGVNLSASLDLQNPRDLGTGKQLARRAKQHGTLAADTRVSSWLLGAEAQFSGRRFNDAGNTQVLSGYTLLNLSASTPIAKDWTLLARVDNLSDRKYELASTYATAGRSYYVGVKWAPK